MKDGEMQIVICDRGWVICGEVDLEADELVVRHGAVVRRWGANAESLGGLARNGPGEDTVLDAFDEWRSERTVIVGRMVCRPGPWEQWLAKRREECREGGYA